MLESAWINITSNQRVIRWGKQKSANLGQETSATIPGIQDRDHRTESASFAGCRGRLRLRWSVASSGAVRCPSFPSPSPGAGSPPGRRRRSCGPAPRPPGPAGEAGRPARSAALASPFGPCAGSGRRRREPRSSALPAGSVSRTWSQRSASPPEASATRRLEPREARTGSAAPVCSAREISSQKSPSQTVTTRVSGQARASSCARSSPPTQRTLSLPAARRSVRCADEMARTGGAPARPIRRHERRRRAVRGPHGHDARGTKAMEDAARNLDVAVPGVEYREMRLLSKRRC